MILIWRDGILWVWKSENPLVHHYIEIFWVLSHFFRQTHFGALKYWQYNGWSSTKGDAWWMAAWHPPLGSRSLSENMLKLQDAVVCSFLQMFALRHWENCHQSAAFDKLPTPAPLDRHFPKRSKPKIAFSIAQDQAGRQHGANGGVPAELCLCSLVKWH